MPGVGQDERERGRGRRRGRSISRSILYPVLSPCNNSGSAQAAGRQVAFALSDARRFPPSLDSEIVVEASRGVPGRLVVKRQVRERGI